MPIEFKHELLEDRVLILPDPKEEKTSSGVYVPQSAQRLSDKGTVIAIGKGYVARETGIEIKMFVNVGDRVLFDKSQCEQYEEYLILFQSGIKFILHED